MHKIMLINPARGDEYPQPPMGLALLAAVLERLDYEVSIIDANALRMPVAEVVSLAAGADVVGLTAMTPSIGQAVPLAAALKEAVPERPIILGGAHATLMPVETLQNAPAIDYLVSGEGEDVLPALLAAVVEGKEPQDIAGVSYRRNGETVHNPRTDKLVDVESLPQLAYHLLPMRAYRPHPPHGQAFPFAAIITSRGCPYHCSYCSKPVFGYRFRGQSAGRVVGEMSRLVADFGIREIAIYDDVFTLNRDRVISICQEILNRGLKLYWSCESRVNLVDEELLALMKRAGCYSIAYGIESAAPEILARLDKNASPEDAIRAVAQTRRAGIQAIGYFMIGSQGENPQTIRQTIDFAKALKLDYAQFSITVPFPGTRLYQDYLAEGHTEEMPWENFTYAGTDVRDMPAFTSEELPREDLGEWQARAYREFYLRPAYIWQRLRQLRNWDSLRLNLRGLKMLAGSINLPWRKR